MTDHGLLMKLVEKLDHFTQMDLIVDCLLNKVLDRVYDWVVGFRN